MSIAVAVAVGATAAMQGTGHVKDVAQVHVFGLAKDVAVQADRGRRVHPFQHQFAPCGGGGARCRREKLFGVAKVIGSHQSNHNVRVAAVHRVANQPCSVQRVRHSPRYCCSD